MRVLDVKGNAEAENENSGKWKGHITASIAAPLDRTWQIGSDFSRLHKFVPIVEVCERLKGRNRTPGCLRFYTMNSATGLPGGNRKAWAKDRLLNIDEETHSYTYAVEGSNMHLENCIISFKASDGKDGTIVKWAWELDPIKKSTKEKTLSDMSEFGCTFIKGLEAAAAAADAIDFDFEGAPPEPHIGDDDEDGYRHVHPVLSLMKSRLETLTQSLNKISQTLEDGPIPSDLYHNELESLQSILAEGRRSLERHMPGYNSDRHACENNSLGITAESHEDYILSTAEAISPPANASTGKIDHEQCYRKCVDAISRLRLSDKGKTIRTLDGGRCQASSSAMFPPLGSKEEEFLLEMDRTSRGAYEAFQDFSNQFHNDLRNDISHQLESVEARLDFLNSGLQDGDLNIPDGGSGGENPGLCSGPTTFVGHKSAQTATQRSSPDARWSPSPPSDGDNMCSPRCRNPEYNPEQFEDWELDELQCGRLQGSPKAIHSARARSGLLFRDILQEEMSQDSDNAAHYEANVSPATFEFTNSPRNLKATMGCVPCFLPQRLAGQRLPASHNPKVTNVPRKYHQSQQQGIESGRFRSGPPLQDDNADAQGGLGAEDLQDLDELETERQNNQGLKMDHGASEVRRRPLGPRSHKKSSNSSSQESQSSEESGEDFQQLEDSLQGWKREGLKMRQIPQNLENDLRRLQSGKNKLQEPGTDESGSGESHENNALRRPSRLPTDIWPNFMPGELDREGNLVNEEQGEDSTRRRNNGHDLERFEFRREEFYWSPTTQKTRDIVREPESLSSSQSSQNYKKSLELQSLPSKFSSSEESLPQTVAGGSRNHTTSPISSLDEIPSSSSPVSGSQSGHLDQQSQCPQSALHSLGQCSQHVILDLRNEIAPGVFHCRQGKQTRVIIDIPGDLEARQASRRHLHSLLRKADIYKEFAHLGIKKPPTEVKLLARDKKQQAISESEAPIHRPYYADGRMFPADAGPSPTNVDKSRLKQAADPTSSHPMKSKSPSGQNAGHSSETQTLTSKNVTLQRPSPTRIIERRPRSEQPLNVTNSFQKDENYITSEGLRGETTARELAGADHSKRTKLPRGGFHPYPGSQPWAQSAEGSSWGHGFPLQQREIPIKGNGRRTSQVRQPSSSKDEAKTNTGVSSSIANSHDQSSSSQGKPQTKRDRAYGEPTSMGSADSFVHQKVVDEIPLDFSTGPEVHPKVGPEIRIYSQAKNLIKINNARDSRQSEGSPGPSSEGSVAKILINFPRDSGDPRLLELTHYTAPTSRQGSLQQVVNNIPSESGSSEFDPYKPGGKFGSINGSAGSDSNNGLPFSRQLHIGDLYQHTTPTTDQPPNMANSLTLIHFDRTEDIEQPNTIDSSGCCYGCPFGQLKNEVDKLIQTSGSPRSISPDLSIRVSWADQHSRQSPLSSRAEGEEEAARTPSSGKTDALREALSSSMSQGLKGGDFPPQPKRSHLLDEVSRELDTQLKKSLHNTEAQTDTEPRSERLRTGQHTQTAGMEPRVEGLRSSQDTKTSMETEVEGPTARQYSQILDSMASTAAESTDDPKAQTEKLDDMVQQSGDMGLISNWNAKKKRKVEALAVRTRSTITMLNSAINVKEFTEDNRSYSSWLDGVAHEVTTPTPQGNAPQTQNSETQASRNFSESSDSSTEELPRREPRFREDSAANFLGSVAGQILHEFSEAQKTDADAQDESKDPQEPRFREDSAANFLSAISEKIVQEFTDYTPNQSPTLDESEAPKERRFREQSALRFLEALSGQLLPEFRNRGGPQAAETSQDWGAHRFRETSAINFLDALRDLVMKKPDQNSVSVSEVPSSSDQTVQSRASQSMPGLKDQLRLSKQGPFLSHPQDQADPTKGLNHEPDAGRWLYSSKRLSYRPKSESHGFLDEGLSSQLESERHGSRHEGLTSRPKSESQGVLNEDLSYRPKSESQGFLNEDLSYRPKSERQGFLDEGLSSQPESERHGSRHEGLSSQPESERHGSSHERLSSQPESERHGSRHERLSNKLKSESQGFLDIEDLSHKLEPFEHESKSHGFPGEGSSSQPESESHGYPGEGLSHKLELESHGFLNERLSHKLQSESQGLWLKPETQGFLDIEDLSHKLESESHLDEGLSHKLESERHGLLHEDLSHKLELEGNGFPGGDFSQKLESESHGFPREGLNHELESHGFPGEGLTLGLEWESHGSPGEGLSSQPESESHGFPGEGLSQGLEWESQGSPGEGLSSQPESESPGFLDEGLSYEPESERQGSHAEALSYQPGSEGQGWGDETLSDHPESEGQEFPAQGLSYHPESEGQGFPDEGLSSQPDPQSDPDGIGSSQPDSSTSAVTDQESLNQWSESRPTLQAQLGAMRSSMGPQGSRRSSQVAVLNEMLQDLHATVSRSRQNSVSNPKGP